ncbi:copper resistance CopC/CopD family protein [Actinoplanes subglobosus]|uniref:Copper resistance protein CopC n=1 Tax=Actinoplanes subglobosus TaxID=1547892 RepID=A0ABV8J197_9ACTN
MLVLLLLGIVVWPAPAEAHATLVSTAPTDGSHLETGPDVVAFTVNEAVSVVRDSPQVIDQDGKRYEVSAVDLAEDRTVVTVRLAAALPDGSFLATARLLSLDTHVVSVSAAFTVGSGAGLISTPQPEGPNPLAYAAKLLTYAGAVGSAGVLLATTRLWPHLRQRRRWRAVVAVSTAVLVTGLVIRLAIEAANRGGDLFSLDGSFAVPALVAIVASIGAAVRPVWILAVATPVALTFGGHGADPAGFPLPLLLTLAHVYAVLAWLGGVLVIATHLRREPPSVTWHRYAQVHAALAAATGLGLGLLRIPAPQSLLTTAYGQALTVKVTLVALALVAAALTYRHLGRTATGGTRWLGAELLMVTVVFGATGVLSSVAPATVSYDPPVTTRIDFGPGSALDISVPSTRRGPQRLIIDGARDAPLSVDLSSKQANVARLPVRLDPARPTGDGVRWTSRDLVVPVTGTWQVTITFGTPAGPRVASFHYDVR